MTMSLEEEKTATCGGCLVKTEIRRHVGERPCEDGGKYWSNGAINHRTPGPTRSLKRQGRALSLESFERAWPCQHLVFGFLASGTGREYICLILSHPVCVNMLLQA